MRRILIVEDKGDERERALKIVRESGRACAGAEDLHEAILHLTGFNIEKKKKVSDGLRFDGVITDLFFPRITDERETEELNGLRIVAYCFKNNIPCVVCTSEGHASTKWWYGLVEELNTKVVASYKKDWQGALESLLQSI